jgi:bacteriorhodopsin
MLRQRDFWAGSMFFLLGVFFAAVAQNYSFGSSAKMGPGYFPTLLGLVLAGLGVLIVAMAIIKSNDPLPRFVWRPLLIVIFAICLYGLLLPVAGFVLATVVLVVVGARADPETRFLQSVALGICLSIFATLIFHYGLGLPFHLWPNL